MPPPTAALEVEAELRAVVLVAEEDTNGVMLLEVGPAVAAVVAMPVCASSTCWQSRKGCEKHLLQ